MIRDKNGIRIKTGDVVNVNYSGIKVVVISNIRYKIERDTNKTYIMAVVSFYKKYEYGAILPSQFVIWVGENNVFNSANRKLEILPLHKFEWDTNISTEKYKKELLKLYYINLKNNNYKC